MFAVATISSLGHTVKCVWDILGGSLIIDGVHVSLDDFESLVVEKANEEDFLALESWSVSQHRPYQDPSLVDLRFVDFTFSGSIPIRDEAGRFLSLEFVLYVDKDGIPSRRLLLDGHDVDSMDLEEALINLNDLLDKYNGIRICACCDFCTFHPYSSSPHQYLCWKSDPAFSPHGNVTKDSLISAMEGQRYEEVPLLYSCSIFQRKKG